jgi:hypothetical protein
MAVALQALAGTAGFEHAHANLALYRVLVTPSPGLQHAALTMTARGQPRGGGASGFHSEVELPGCAQLAAPYNKWPREWKRRGGGSHP